MSVRHLLMAAAGAAAAPPPLMTDGTAYVWATAATPGLTWNAVAYGNGMWVAVSSTTTINTSPDGITWTLRTLTPSLVYVAFGGGLFVALGTGSRNLWTSPDGITWTQRTLSGVSVPYTQVAYGNGMWVAMSSNDATLQSSPDGITWTQRFLAYTNTNGALAYSSTLGLFSILSSGTNCSTSPDGITWTQRPATANVNWRHMACSGGMFIALTTAATNTTCYSSPDGYTWTARTLPSATTWSRVAYGNGAFVAVGASTSTGYAARSTDGITWTGVPVQNVYTSTTNSGAAPALGCVGYGNGRFVVGNTANTAISGFGLSVPNFGINWTTNRTLNNGSTAVRWDNGRFMSLSAVSPYTTQRSTDGINWTAGGNIPFPLGTTMPVAFGNNTWVYLKASSPGANDCATSTDNGTTWTLRTTGTSISWSSCAYGAGLFVGITAGGTTSYGTSPDGITWTTRTTMPSASFWRGIAWLNNQFVLFSQGAIATSPDGITWTQRTTPNVNTYKGVYSNGAYFTDGLLWSTDAITWTARSVPSGYTGGIRCVETLGNGVFCVAISDGSNTNYPLFLTLDGITFTGPIYYVGGSVTAGPQYTLAVSPSAVVGFPSGGNTYSTSP